MSQSAEDARIRGLRPAREQVDAWHPHAVLREEERAPDGVVPTITVFLSGSECPFTCVFCDLWRFTTEAPTPEGAIPAQIAEALDELGPAPPGCRIKLYNASNFFDRRAVPRSDLPEIARLLGGFERVVVECHPRLVGPTLFEFAERLDSELEIAMGLETVHPQALPRLNKKMSKEDFDNAAAALREHHVPYRAFVLVGTPFVAPRDSVDWTVVSAAYALERGAETVTLIPMRGGNGELERLRATGSFHPPTLEMAEESLERSLLLPGGAIIQLDLWDLERLAECEMCFQDRRSRLERINLTGQNEPPIECSQCRRKRGRRR